MNKDAFVVAPTATPAESQQGEGAGRKAKRKRKRQYETLKGFGLYLKQCRRYNNKRQHEIAAKIKCSQRWYSKLERGQIQKPNPEWLERLARLYSPKDPAAFFTNTVFDVEGRPDNHYGTCGFCPSPECSRLEIKKVAITGKLVLYPIYYTLFEYGPVPISHCMACGTLLETTCWKCDSAIHQEDCRNCANCGAFLFRCLVNAILLEITEEKRSESMAAGELLSRMYAAGAQDLG